MSRDPFELPADMDLRARGGFDDALRAAQARDAIPTLAEVMAAGSWVSLPGGGIVPSKLDRGPEAGWGQDEDRDSKVAQALAEHVKSMDELARRWRDQASKYPLRSEAVDMAGKLADTWAAIRKITRENGGR